MQIKKFINNRWDEIAFSVGLLFVAFLVVNAFYTVHISAEKNKLVTHTYQVIQVSDDLISAMKDAETGQRGFVLTGEQQYLQPYNSATQSIGEILLELKRLTSDNPEQQQRLEQIEGKIELKLDELNETINLRKNEGMEAAMEVIKTDKGKQVMDDFRRLLTEFQQKENKLLSQRDEETEATAFFWLSIQSAAGLFVLFFLTSALVRLRRQKKSRATLFQELDTKNKEYLLNNGQSMEEENEVISSLVANLQNAKEFIRKIGEKDFDAQIPGLKEEYYQLNTQNMAGALLEVRELLKEKEKEEKRRQWSNEGIAIFSEIIRRHNQNLETLANEVLQQLVKYVKANQGGLYILNKDEKAEPFMEMTACYAWNKKKYISTKIGKGEGLVGQAWQEKDTLFLTDVPNDYVRITSGLGGANPGCILIVPLQINEEVLGAMEIASFQKLEKFEIEFIEKIAETIASALSTVTVNERTKQLLEQAQEQAEEMRAQEEEMRQNMEELEATQEEMRRQEMEMRGQITAANNTLATIEFDTQGNIQTANQNFLNTMGYSLEEIKGRHHRIFCETDYANSAEYRELWEQLNKGISISNEFKRIAKNKKEVWLRATYTPVLDHHGNPVKIIKYALEVTHEKLESLDLHGQIEAINLSNAVIEFSSEGKVLRANQLFLELMGYEEKQIVGKHHSLFVPEEIQKSEDYQQHWKNLKAGKFLEGEYERVSKGGNSIWIKATYNPVFDLNGKVVKVVKIAQDITEKRFLEEEMRQNMEEMQATQEELSEKLSENEKMKRNLDAYLKALDAAALMSEADIYGNITYVNDRFCEVAKYSREEVIGKPHNILRHPDNPKELFKEMWHTIKSGKVFKGRYPNKAKDGSTYWVDATIEPVIGADGKIEKYIGIRFDITEQVKSEQEITQLVEDLKKKMEDIQGNETLLRNYVIEQEKVQEELAEKEREASAVKEELKARMDALDAAALMSEADIYGNITYVNSKFCEVAKYTPEEVIGKPHNILRHPDNSKELFKEMWATIKAGKIFQGRYPNKAKDGSTYWVDATIVPVLDEKGKPVKYIGVRFDITKEMTQNKVKPSLN